MFIPALAILLMIVMVVRALGGVYSAMSIDPSEYKDYL
jgi:hypothetical protein